jgi:hypothetical protein
MIALLPAGASEPSGLSTLLEVVQAASIVVAAVVAIHGISSWRRETRGKREMELAEEVLALFYEARDVIAAIRSPLGHSNEGQTRKAKPSETPEEKGILDQSYVPIERYSARAELFNTLRAKRYRFMACFGKDKATPFNNLAGITSRIIVAARWLGRLRMQQAKGQGLGPGDDGLQRLAKSVQEKERIIWSEDDEDAIDKEVDQIILEIEAVCQPILCPKKRWCDRWVN